MTSHAEVHAPADPLANPLDWVTSMVVKIATVWGTAMLIAGGLYYTWGALASMFSFTNPLGGYWTYVLAVLGAYAAYSVYRAVRDGVWYSITDALNSGTTRATLFDSISTPAAILIAAWVISDFVA